MAARAAARAPALVIVCTLVAGVDATAQAPGYPQLDPASVRAEYVAEVLERINDVAAMWGEAWSGDRIDELVELYWDDAVLIPPGRIPLRGRDLIREYLAEVTPVHGHVEAFMLDFDASGGMSTVFGNYMIGIQQGEDAGNQLMGPVVTVYMMRGRTWKIRSQVFVSAASASTHRRASGADR